VLPLTVITYVPTNVVAVTTGDTLAVRGPKKVSNASSEKAKSDTDTDRGAAAEP
jgi:hypothetical protein